MTVSLIITTYNWPEALQLVLLSVFKQKVKPDEIVIADDGSTDVTRELINNLRVKTDIEIHHVWHEDNGFRRTVILNKAIAKASGDYIIQLDGDMVIHPYFIREHLELAEKGFYVSGSRVCLKENITRKMLLHSITQPNISGMTLDHMLNNLRIGIFRKYWAKKHYKSQTKGTRGCNLAFWRNDFIKINGYNENMTGWGYEDTEMVLRLYNIGLQRKRLKMGGVGYHLWHNTNSKQSESTNLNILKQTIDKKYVTTKDGVDKYLIAK